MVKLYGGARSRASIVQWYLEELQVPYEFVLLDMQAGEHRQPPFLSLNPFGKVPVLVDGDLVLSESGAILLYLAQQYDASYPQAPKDQAIFYQWVLFANSTLGNGLFIEASREREMPILLGPLEARFAQQPFMMGDRFTVADVAVGAMLGYIPLMLKLDLSDYPQVAAYIERMAARPAYQKAIIRRETS